MNQTDKISVIIPVYNGEEYINQCVESVLNQSYHNIEVLLVDDGSRDKSGKICEEYQRKDIRVKVIHKNNEGVSSARNEGLKRCKGEYVAFVDSDDYVEKDYLECLYQKLRENNADIAACNFSYVFKDGRKQEENQLKSKCMLLNDDLNYCQNSFLYYIWGKIFKKEMLKDLSFDTRLSVAEDSLFVAEVIKKSGKLYYEQEPLYMYRMNPNSVMHEKDIKKLETQLIAWEKISALQNADSTAYWSARMQYLKGCRRVAAEIWLSENRNFEKIRILKNEVGKYIGTIWKVKDSLIQKITLLLFYCTPHIYFHVYAKKSEKEV